MKTREIVLSRASIVAAVGFAVSVAAVFGLPIDAETQTRIVDALVLVLPVALPLAGALWARLHVTPVWDPVDAEGNRLVASAESMAAAHGSDYEGRHRAS